MVGGMDKEVGQWSRKAQESDLGTEGVSKEKCMFPGGYANNTGLFIYIYCYLHEEGKRSYYFLHIFLFIPIYFLSLVGFLSQMISCHISSWGYSEGRVRIDFLSLWGTQTAILI